ncbi:hypothetical protein CAEBREN_03555 [Caenorhabditis brenneri]|uniref:EGF-like domain-containing protein n=1 Tax=Caenorhabditis brenneri TaxID=135651 RepID=G0NHQ1_CAEBE|nr:hypothetical protein CAEBREN_03555 [Caenorhabditis brenneri]
MNFVPPELCSPLCSAQGNCVIDSSPFCVCSTGFGGPSCDAALSPPSSIWDYFPWFILLLSLGFWMFDQGHRWMKRRRRREASTQTGEAVATAPPIV